MGGREYLAEDCQERISSISESHPDYSEDTITEFYQKECAKFEEVFTEDAPLSAVRRSAWSQTKKALREDNLPDTGDSSEN